MRNCSIKSKIVDRNEEDNMVERKAQSIAGIQKETYHIRRNAHNNTSHRGINVENIVSEGSRRFSVGESIVSSACRHAVTLPTTEVIHAKGRSHDRKPASADYQYTQEEFEKRLMKGGVSQQAARQIAADSRRVSVFGVLVGEQSLVAIVDRSEKPSEEAPYRIQLTPFQKEG